MARQGGHGASDYRRSAVSKSSLANGALREQRRHDTARLGKAVPIDCLQRVSVSASRNRWDRIEWESPKCAIPSRPVIDGRVAAVDALSTSAAKTQCK